MPDSTAKQQIYEHQNLLEQIVNLQNDLKKHENSINRLLDIESDIVSKIRVVKNDESYDHPKSQDRYNIGDLCDPVINIKDDFVETDIVTSLSEFCKKQSFSAENGHSIIMFGEQYSYNSKSKAPAPSLIPEILNSLITQVATEFPEAKTTNQVLINKYEGPLLR